MFEREANVRGSTRHLHGTCIDLPSFVTVEDEPLATAGGRGMAPATRRDQLHVHPPKVARS
jgi:hypothetical protein